MKQILAFLMLASLYMTCYAYKDILEQEVGDTFTLDGGSYRYIQAVLWTYDTSVFETVSVSGYSTRGKFKAISPTPSSGSVIQATIYYYKDGTTSSGVNKAVVDWKVYVADDGSESTVSLPISMSMELNEIKPVTATTSSPKYSGKFTWQSSNHYIAEVLTYTGNTAQIRANSPGSTYIHVTLENGNTDSMYITVNNVELPTVSANPSSGTYDKGTKIYLTASQSDATIRYTIDGSTPTTSSAYYSTAITINESFTLKSRAYNSNGDAGEVLTCNYVVNEPKTSELAYNILSSSDRTVEVVRKNGGYEGDIVVPETTVIEGVTYTVSKIGTQAFSSSKITSIQLPNTLKEIGSYAFDNCKWISEIILPESVVSVGTFAFSGCINLKYLYLGKNLTTFSGMCISDHSYGNNYCGNKLKEFKLNPQNPYFSVKDGVLFDKTQEQLICYPLAKEGAYRIPSTVKTIKRDAFNSCFFLTSIDIPSTITSIESFAFTNCNSISSVSIPESIDIIPDFAFYYCTNLSDIKLSESLKDIGRYSFASCALKSINLPNSLETIEDDAFRYNNLTSVYLPQNIKRLDVNAFNDNNNLQNIYVDSGNSLFSANDGVLFNNTQSKLILYPCGRRGSYIIPNSVQIIGQNSFSSCRKLSQISIPSSVVTIDHHAFMYCDELVSVYIPNSVTQIMNGVFYGCNKLQSVVIPNSVKSIGSKAFFECKSLTSIYYNSDSPIQMTDDAFVYSDNDSSKIYDNVILYVPEVAVEKCKQISPWNNFKCIQPYDFASIEDVSIERDANTTNSIIYNLNGLKVADSVDNLPTGIYIVRQGSHSKKIVIK